LYYIICKKEIRIKWINIKEIYADVIFIKGGKEYLGKYLVPPNFDETDKYLVDFLDISSLILDGMAFAGNKLEQLLQILQNLLRPKQERWRGRI